MKNKIIDFLLSFRACRNAYNRKLIREKTLLTIDSLQEELEKANQVLLPDGIDKSFRVGLVKDDPYDVTGYIYTRSYYPRYERFLRNNNIQYSYYNILSANWIEEAKRYDVVIWHSYSDPANQAIAKNKIYMLEKVLNKRCLPSYGEIWLYEDKINQHYLYQGHQLPEIPTFVFCSKVEALNYVEYKTSFPLVSKITTGSASYGVEKVLTKSAAERLINQAFSRKGRKTYFPFIRQKNYVYFQQYMRNARYDLRIIVIEDKLFGYYRYPQKGDFRASGAGIYEKKEIPFDALELAYRVKQCFNSVCLITDLLYDEVEKKYYIIESSTFIGVDTSEQLKINDIPGYYRRISPESYVFNPGRFWIQELSLEAFFTKDKR